MEIVVQGRNVDVDPAIDADSRRKLGKLSRLASDIRRIDVEFSEVKNPRGRRLPAVRGDRAPHAQPREGARIRARTARTALDRVVDKVGQQLNKVHDKRVHRARPRHPGPPAAAPPTVD